MIRQLPDNRAQARFDSFRLHHVRRRSGVANLRMERVTPFAIEFSGARPAIARGANIIITDRRPSEPQGQTCRETSASSAFLRNVVDDD